jgi:hypothetical protein
LVFFSQFFECGFPSDNPQRMKRVCWRKDTIYDSIFDFIFY